MQVYVDLLKETGFQIDEREFALCFPELKDEEPQALCIYNYHKADEEVATFVQNEKESLVPDYHDEVRAAIYNKIHRYSRRDRFKFLVYQLIGLSGGKRFKDYEVDPFDKMLKIVRRELPKYLDSRLKIWNTMRRIMKAHGYRRYYNRIPEIIAIVKGWKPEGVGRLNLDLLFDEFWGMSAKFDAKLRDQWEVKYFPNLRFIALKLIQKHGVTYPYYTPLVKTASKKKYLENLYEDFIR